MSYKLNPLTGSFDYYKDEKLAGYSIPGFTFKASGTSAFTDFISGSGTYSTTTDTTRFATGTNSLGVSLTGNGSTIKARKLQVSWDFKSSAAKDYIGLRVYRNRCGTLPDVYDPLTLYMSNDQFLGSNIATVTPPTSTHYQQGWSTIPIYKGVTGNPLYMPKFTDIAGNINFGSNILAAHILFNSFESYTAQLNVDSIFHGLYERPKISINFDDCFSSAYNIGHQECIRRGMKSTAFASFRTVGTADPNYMTVSQFQTLAANPLVEIGLHSDKRFDGGGSQILATPAEEIAANIAGIAALNVPMVPYGAWPEGQYRQDDPSIALEPIRSAGIKGMRSTYRGYTIFNSGCYNPYSIGSVDLSQAHSVAQIKSIVDACVAYGLSMSFNAHKIVDSGSLADGLTYLTADYVEILDYIATKRASGLLDVVFFSEMIEKSPTPLVSF